MEVEYHHAWLQNNYLAVVRSIPILSFLCGRIGGEYGIVLAYVPRQLALIRVGTSWNWPEGTCSGQELASHLTLVASAGLFPRPDISPQLVGRVEPGPQFHIMVPASVALIKFSSSDRIMTWWLCRLWSFTSSFTSRGEIWDPTNIRWVAVK